MTDFRLAPRPDPAIAQDGSGGLAFAFERSQDAPAVEALVDRAFGPGRFAKTAERLREQSRLRRDLSICAWADGALAGAVRQWPVRIGETNALFLGPIAVDATQRKVGLGRALMARAVTAAQGSGEGLILLVGDEAYFGQFGFERVPAGAVVMPGPVDMRRVLWRGASEGVSGLVRGSGG